MSDAAAAVASSTPSKAANASAKKSPAKAKSGAVKKSGGASKAKAGGAAGAAHPKYSVMVVKALSELKERNGSSRQGTCPSTDVFRRWLLLFPLDISGLK